MSPGRGKREGRCARVSRAASAERKRMHVPSMAVRIHLLDKGGGYLVGKVLILNNPLEELDATPLDHRHEQASPPVCHFLLAHMLCICFA